MNNHQGNVTINFGDKKINGARMGQQLVSLYLHHFEVWVKNLCNMFKFPFIRTNQELCCCVHIER